MKKAFLVFFLAVFVLIPLISLAAGLVPCGGEGEPACQLCHFFVLFKNIIDFLLFKIVPPLAVLMIAIGGFMHIFAYVGPAEILSGGTKGGPAMISQAKKLFSSVVIGLLIIYGAWLVVSTFFMVIGINEFNEFKTLPQNWWKINCPVP